MLLLTSYSVFDPAKSGLNLPLYLIEDTFALQLLSPLGFQHLLRLFPRSLVAEPFNRASPMVILPDAICV